MSYKMPFILLAIIIIVILFGELLSIKLQQNLYSISFFIKSIIIFLLPIIIFCLLYKAIINLSSKAASFLLLVIGSICFSNFVTTFLSHYVGALIYKLDLSMQIPSDRAALATSWMVEIPSFIGNEKAMFLGIISPIIMKLFNPKMAQNLALQLDKLVSIILKLFQYLIPLFVMGFIIKLRFDGTIYLIIKNYTLIFCIIALTQCCYITLLYLIANNFKILALFSSLKNMLPGAITGFSTMSSAASLPFSIIGVENNTKNKNLASSIMPISVNIHLIGDCIAIPIFAYAILKSNNIMEPTLISYITFTFYFVIAKFSVAAIPGGGIIVMLPILQTYLGFNGDMMTLITALYILFDPVITSINVLGNGAFAQIIDNQKILKL